MTKVDNGMIVLPVSLKSREVAGGTVFVRVDPIRPKGPHAALRRPGDGSGSVSIHPRRPRVEHRVRRS